MMVTEQQIREILNKKYRGTDTFWFTNKGSGLGLYFHYGSFHLNMNDRSRNFIILNYFGSPHRLRLNLI